MIWLLFGQELEIRNIHKVIDRIEGTEHHTEYRAHRVEWACWIQLQKSINRVGRDEAFKSFYIYSLYKETHSFWDNVENHDKLGRTELCWWR